MYDVTNLMERLQRKFNTYHAGGWTDNILIINCLTTNGITIHAERKRCRERQNSEIIISSKMSSNSLSFILDFQASYVSHKMRLHDEVVDNCDIPLFLTRKPRAHKKRDAVNKGSMETSFCESLSTFSNSTSSDLEDLDDDEATQEQYEEVQKAFFIPGITGKARCLEGATTGTAAEGSSTARRRVTPTRGHTGNNSIVIRSSSRSTTFVTSASSSCGSAESLKSIDTYYERVYLKSLDNLDEQSPSSINDVEDKASRTKILQASRRELRLLKEKLDVSKNTIADQDPSV